MNSSTTGAINSYIEEINTFSRYFFIFEDDVRPHPHCKAVFQDNPVWSPKQSLHPARCDAA